MFLPHSAYVKSHSTSSNARSKKHVLKVEIELTDASEMAYEVASLARHNEERAAAAEQAKREAEEAKAEKKRAIENQKRLALPKSGDRDEAV
ncbi:MAG: hypothetical protein N4A53_08220 [Pelagimonas sp.]|jgi:uncharacterized membrane protein YukC|nr:hypothetical protein [Pelagimonas sp.]